MFGKLVPNSVTSPAEKHRLDINENYMHMDEQRSEVLQSVTENLLYVTKRARPDIESTVSFLCERVSKSNEDYWKILQRLIGFVKVAINNKRVIGVTGVNDLWTWLKP